VANAALFAPKRSLAWADAPADAERRVGVWLLGVAVLVFAMIIVGGATRLTDSGLSITEWKPLLGAIPPLTHAQWMGEFDKYREIAQYQLKNRGMTLAEFQFIFWWEWAHRQLGRVIGLAFALPLVWFHVTRQLKPGLAPRLVAMLALGGLQGAIGWWMVSSGIGTDRLQVAAYRLAVHLGMAFLLLGLLVWTASDLLGRRRRGAGDAAVAPWSLALCGLVFVQVILGAFVAGTDAGFVYTDWPMMGGAWLPQHYFALSPWPLNLVENLQAIQFNHRIGAYLVCALAALAALRAMASRDQGVRGWGLAALACVLAQAGLGVATLLGFGRWTPPQIEGVLLGIAHQGFGAVLFVTVLLFWRAARPARG
jgi:cytochrome c oxidase assembly protein subunit 15